MLAAAIRASLIEAGEPDTSQQADPATSSQQPATSSDQADDQRQQLQTDSLPTSSSSLPQQESSLLQDRYHQQQHQKQDSQEQDAQQQQQQHMQQGRPYGNGITSGFSAAAWQSTGMASAVQGSAAGVDDTQGRAAEQGLGQGRALHMRPSWSSNALTHQVGQAAEPLVSASSTPVETGRLLPDEAQLEGSEPSGLHEHSPLLTRSKSSLLSTS